MIPSKRGAKGRHEQVTYSMKISCTVHNQSYLHVCLVDIWKMPWNEKPFVKLVELGVGRKFPCQVVRPISTNSTCWWVCRYRTTSRCRSLALITGCRFAGCDLALLFIYIWEYSWLQTTSSSDWGISQTCSLIINSGTVHTFGFFLVWCLTIHF